VFPARSRIEHSTHIVIRRIPCWRICTSRSGSRKGSGFNSAASTKLKMAVMAPMPSASVITATAVKPGLLSKDRPA
jgi:hypothetical protein